MATILLLDDERILRTLLRVALERRGHRVLEASTRKRAAALSRTHHGRLDLLVTQWKTPRASAATLADTLTADRPEMAVLYLSRHHGAEQVGAEHEVLAEPFNIHDVLTRIESLLTPPRRKPGSNAPRHRAKRVS